MSLIERRVSATSVLLLWIVTLALLAGPVRWEFAHSYSHQIAGAGADLPTPTLDLALPILGLGAGSLAASLVKLLFWGICWLGPGLMLLGVWRAASPEAVLERFVFGGALYGSLMLLLAIALAVSLWLPFGLLG